MAVYDNLPVFKASYDLLTDVYRFSDNWKRDCRYTIGEGLKQNLMDIMVDIYKANSSVEKKAYIENACQKIVVVTLQFRLLHDLGQLPMKQFAALAERTESISKQLTAWKRSLK